MAEKSWSLGRALRGMFVKPTIDETTWEDLETALITADFGPDISERVVEELRQKVERYRTTDPQDLQRMLRETLEEHFAKFDTTLKLTERPAVVLVVGVNGVGKTTTIGKFTKFLRGFQRSVVVGAGERRSSVLSRRGRIRHPSRSRPSTTRSARGSRSRSSTPRGACTPRAA
jgi:fused signal recognition particle receptor